MGRKNEQVAKARSLLSDGQSDNRSRVAYVERGGDIYYRKTDLVNLLYKLKSSINKNRGNPNFNQTILNAQLGMTQLIIDLISS